VCKGILPVKYEDNLDRSLPYAVLYAQAWELPQNNPWNAEHLFRAAKFSNVRSLTLLFDTNHGADTTCIYYLAFKGVFTPLKSEPIVAQYELRPVPGMPYNPY
jgi:hypothetical protein